MSSLVWVLWLNAVGGVILMLWMGLSGGASATTPLAGGFRGYADELARAATSWSRLGVYTAWLGLYAVGIEVILRRAVQEPLARRWGTVWGVMGSAVVYALAHIHHGAIGALYALTLGWWTGFVYSRMGRLRVMAGWHLQWDALTAVAALWMGLATPGSMRDAMNFAYKSELVRTGRVQYHPVYGWLDAAHYWGTQRRLCETMRAMDEGSEVMLTSLWAHVDGTVHRVQTRYRLVPGGVWEGRARLEVAASVVWDAAVSEEASQAEATVMSGMRMSAWSFEDLPTTLLALHDALETPGWSETCAARARPMPDGYRITGAMTEPGSRSELQARWAREGRELVRRRGDGGWQPGSPNLRKTLGILQTKKGLAWERLSAPVDSRGSQSR